MVSNAILLIGLALGVAIAIATGTLYYWKASSPYRALALQGQREAEADITILAKMKDYDPATIARMRERQVAQQKRMSEIETMRQTARQQARIAAISAGLISIALWIFGANILVRRRTRTGPDT